MTHPTPAEIRSAIFQRLYDEAAARGEIVPQWILSAIRQGVSDANAEHDRANAQQVAA